MTPHIENLIQSIGSELLAACRCEPSAAVLYAEFEDGVVSPSVFYTAKGSSTLIFKFASDNLSSLAYELWEAMASQANQEKWRAMVYSVQNGKLSIRPIFGDHFDDSIGENKRRLSAATEVLGGGPVDYSNP